MMWLNGKHRLVGVMLLVLVAVVDFLAFTAQAHIEDICIAPPGKCAKCGIYNFYTLASRLGCAYLEQDAKCVTATTIAQSKSGFGETSVCRGIIHFNSIYFLAVALGFKQEIAYAMAGFSQAIDFVQYRAVDSCGQNMSAGFWTPPMQGLLRTQTSFGGTNYHLGIPWVGMFPELKVVPANLNSSSLQGEVLTQRRKIYTGTPYPLGCRKQGYSKSFSYYRRHCPALNPNLMDGFYDGALSAGRRWAFNETNILCIGGFTIEDKESGSLFTGKACPKKGRQFQVNVGPVVQGPIPLSGPQMELGDQVIHFQCDPNCTAPDYTIKKGSQIYATEFGAYLKAQSLQHGFATLNDPPGVVPELVARFGIYLHWIADRASHWYCTDASESGIVTVRENDYYNSFVYLSMRACNFINHGMVHYWEQGVHELAPGSYFALRNMYNEILNFRLKFLNSHPEWFRPGAQPLSLKTVVGNKQKPGVLYRITNIVEAEERFRAEIRALRAFKLPPMPGFEHLCTPKATRD